MSEVNRGGQGSYHRRSQFTPDQTYRSRAHARFPLAWRPLTVLAVFDGGSRDGDRWKGKAAADWCDQRNYHSRSQFTHDQTCRSPWREVPQRVCLQDRAL